MHGEDKDRGLYLYFIQEEELQYINPDTKKISKLEWVNINDEIERWRWQANNQKPEGEYASLGLDLFTDKESSSLNY